MKKQYVEKVFVYRHFDIDEFHQMQSMLEKNKIIKNLVRFFLFLLPSHKIAPLSTIAKAIRYCV
jgi:hypothetical protein